MVIFSAMVIAVMAATAVNFACRAYRLNQENSWLLDAQGKLESDLQAAQDLVYKQRLQIDNMDTMISDQKMLIEGRQGEIALLEKYIATMKRDYVPQSDLTEKTAALRDENDKLIKEINRVYTDIGKLKSELNRKQEEAERLEPAERISRPVPPPRRPSAPKPPPPRTKHHLPRSNKGRR